jgi:hypothetical protein
VYATLTTSCGHALVGARPYLPREWAEDADRRANAGVPEHVVFKTKPALAVGLLTDLHTAEPLPSWATGDEVYGRDKALREFCEWHSVGYVFGVPCSFPTICIGERRGANVAKVATARKLLTLVYYGLRDGHIRCLAGNQTPASDRCHPSTSDAWRTRPPQPGSPDTSSVGRSEPASRPSPCGGGLRPALTPTPHRRMPTTAREPEETVTNKPGSGS